MTPTKKGDPSEQPAPTYLTLEAVAWRLLHGPGEEPSFDALLGSMLFTALGLEAFLNHVGALMLPYWDILEASLRPREKLEVIAMALDYSIDFGRMPFQAFGEIFSFRNDVVHTKSVRANRDTYEWSPEWIATVKLSTAQQGATNDRPEVPAWAPLVTKPRAAYFIDQAHGMVKEISEQAKGFLFW
jgi:hypothetical protein